MTWKERSNYTDQDCIGYQLLSAIIIGLPRWLSGKNLPANAADTGLIPRLERSTEERYGSPLHYSYLENSMDRGAWLATAHGITWSLDTTEHTYMPSIQVYLSQLTTQD